MKMRRIPETDLARIAVLPESDQRGPLKYLKSFRPPHTLNPFRRAVPDIMSLQYELLGRTSEASWEAVKNSICSSNESDDGKEKNLEVAKALFEYSRENEIVSYDKPIARWPVGFENSVEYWQQFYSVWGGRGTFVFFDPRLSNPLTKQAMRFVLSMMHERLRVDDPDFSSLGLAIFKFGQGEGATRTVRIHTDEDFKLFTRDELNEMITTTYRLWAEELSARREEARRATGTDNPNPMGF
jgi:hypothetical protein